MTFDPLEALRAWRDEAADAGELEPDAMALATATPDGRPSVRMVLLRGIEGTVLRFFTNYESRKALEIESNPRASVCFHWARFRRQVRVEGTLARLAPEISDLYFASRPRGSQLAAIASPQSRPIESLDAMRTRVKELAEAYEGQPVPRPASWGGYGLNAEKVELWIGGEDRLHERRLFVRAGETWQELRLGP